MLGNDVVDLGDPETQPGASHPRFDARVFSAQEREALADCSDPVRLRWRLWAAKEAAYKCARKADPGTSSNSGTGDADVRMPFAPARFAVQLDDSTGGSVLVGARRLRVRFFESGDALHAVATDADDSGQRVLRAVATLPAGADPLHASAAVRALARDLAAAHLGCAADEIEVEREGRIPRLRRRGVPVGLDLSLAHHGRFLAAALQTRPRERTR